MSLLAARRGTAAARRSGGGGGGPTFDPTTIADLAYWFDADAITGLSDTDPVATWPDGSGNGRDVTQGTASSRPTYRTGVLNGRPVVRFDGGDALSTSGSGPTLSQPTTAFAVAKQTGSSSSRQYIFDATSASNGARHILALDQASKVSMWAGAWLAGADENTAWKLIRGLYNGASSTLHVDGALTASGNVGSGTFSGIRLGVNHVGSADHLNGDIAEVLVYNRALNSEEVSDVEDYLTGKWGL